MTDQRLTAAEYRELLFGPELARGHATGATSQLAPSINEITDKHLFEGVWQDGRLALRERSLVTIAAMVSLGHEREIGYHIQAAMRQGIAKEAIVGVIVQLMFYIGLPNTHLALRVAQEQFSKSSGE